MNPIATDQHPVLRIVLPGAVQPSGLLTESGSAQTPAAGRVLLRMQATGVSFAEQQMRRGRYYDQPPFPFVPGYDLVGRVSAVGDGVDATLLGRRMAAVTKTGAWAEEVEVDARALLPVPDGFDDAEVEAVIVNGITAWRMLHELAAVRRGGTVVVLGANGGVGSTLTQLAVHAGIRVLGTAAPRHHALLRELGAEPVDSAPEGLPERLRALAGGGVDAVFDHVGGPGLRDSWRLVRRGGALVAYGTASTRDATGSGRGAVLALLGRVALWDALPNGRRAYFFDLWRGSRRPERFHAAQAAAFAQVLALLESRDLVPRIAARLPLREAARALELAESRTVAGKVVLLG